MKQIINEIFNILKIVLLLIAFVLVFYGLLVTYGRIDRSMVHAIPTLLPFILLLILFVLNFILKNKYVNKNLFFNVAATISLLSIIFVAYRAKFESNATLYYKYKINFNPSYFADNIGTIRILAYLLVIVNILLLVYSIFFKTNKKEEKNNDTKSIAESEIKEITFDDKTVDNAVEVKEESSPIVEDKLSETEELSIIKPEDQEDNQVYSIPQENRVLDDNKGID